MMALYPKAPFHTSQNIIHPLSLSVIVSFEVIFNTKFSNIKTSVIREEYFRLIL